MSQKRHKNIRALKKDVEPKKERERAGIMKVELLKDGGVQVRDFPNVPQAAIQILCAGIIELCVHFISQAKIDSSSLHTNPVRRYNLTLRTFYQSSENRFFKPYPKARPRCYKPDQSI